MFIPLYVLFSFFTCFFTVCCTINQRLQVNELTVPDPRGIWLGLDDFTLPPALGDTLAGELGYGRIFHSSGSLRLSSSFCRTSTLSSAIAMSLPGSSLNIAKS